MDVVDTTEETTTLSLPVQVAKTVIAAAAAVIAGDLAKKAFDRVISARANKTT
jgi:hypothetical protein